MSEIADFSEEVRVELRDGSFAVVRPIRACGARIVPLGRQLRYVSW